MGANFWSIWAHFFITVYVNISFAIFFFANHSIKKLGRTSVKLGSVKKPETEVFYFWPYHFFIFFLFLFKGPIHYWEDREESMFTDFLQIYTVCRWSWKSPRSEILGSEML